MATEAESWKRCSSCKTGIGFGEGYYVCSVSTCNRKRTALAFCSVSCWEVHVPMMRHRDSGAVEQRAPSQAEWARQQAADAEANVPSAAPASKSPSTSPAPGKSSPSPERESVRRLVRPAATATRASLSASTPSPESLELSDDFPVDVLIVASKLKSYIKARSGMNTSDAVLKTLSDHVRALCDRAIGTAAENERKTVMDRDFPKP